MLLTTESLEHAGKSRAREGAGPQAHARGSVRQHVGLPAFEELWLTALSKRLPHEMSPPLDLSDSDLIRSLVAIERMCAQSQRQVLHRKRRE